MNKKIKDWDNRMRLLNEVHDEIKINNENETEKQAQYYNKN